MPAIVAAIVLVLAFILAIMASVLLLWGAAFLILPLIISFGIFLLLLPLWLDTKIDDNSPLLRAIALQIEGDRVLWKANYGGLSIDAPHLLLVNAALLAATLVMFEIYAKQVNYHVGEYIFFGALLALGSALVGPHLLYFRFQSGANKLILDQLAGRLSTRYGDETASLIQILGLEEEIIELLDRMGVSTAADAAETCRDVILNQGLFKKQNVASTLKATIIRLETDTTELKNCVALYESTVPLFETAKRAVIDSGSGALVEELERIWEDFNSEHLTSLLENRKWSHAKEFLERLKIDLEKLEKATSGAHSTAYGMSDDQLPQTVQEAYQLLNVNDRMSKDEIHRVVKAMQAVWHPDGKTDGVDTSLRHKKMVQINKAWELIKEEINKGGASGGKSS